MISTKRCNEIATPRNTRLLCGSLPIKKRTFQPFKKTGGPFDLTPFHRTPGSIHASDQKIHAVVSRDSCDASSPQEPTSGTTNLNTGLQFLCNDDSNSSSSEDRISQSEIFYAQGKQAQEHERQPSTALNLQNHPRLSSSSQDRRYTGALSETRCSATTTRGRACAYIAVGNSMYCNMHSEYDTNPPPRRGLKSQSTSRRADKPAVPLHEDRLPAPPVLDNSMDTSKATEACVARHETYEHGETDKGSSNPLLSAISTDQWFQKTVRVAAGPLKGRVGLVEKWGNGWVSVHIPDVGLHNRRSFELYLHSHDEAGDPAEMSDPHTKRIYHESSNPCRKQHLSVSRTWIEDNPRDICPSVVTPRSSMTSQTVVASRNSQRSSPIRLDSSCNERSKEPGTCNVVTPPTQWRSLVSETTNIPSLNGIVDLRMDEGHIPTTFYAMPARERNRRSVHKPSRFQETKMLENIHSLRKRSRSRGDEEDIEKRSRHGLYI